MNIRSASLLAGLVACIACAPAAAERADRNKPVNLEADQVTVDDRARLHIFTGRVTLSQGTLSIRADKIVVSQDVDGWQKGVATGGADGLSRFRQKREGRDEWIEGEAERIEYDARNEQTQFFVRAFVKSGADEVRGQYIRYEGLTEQYVVTNGPNETTVSSGGANSPRVRAVIQPKGRESALPAPSIPLKPAETLGRPSN